MKDELEREPHSILQINREPHSILQINRIKI